MDFEFSPAEQAFAARMAAEVQAFAAALGGSLTCVTSRRSGAAVEAALQQAAPRAEFHFWRRERQENPYLGYLALADILVVTGESESMLAEAADAAKPLYIYPIPAKPAGLRVRCAGWVLAAARRGNAACEELIQSGIVVPPRDLGLMHGGMVEAGVARRFGAGAGAGEGADGAAAAHRFDTVLARIREILERS